MTDPIREQTIRLLTKTLSYGARIAVQIADPSLARLTQDAMESLVRSAVTAEPACAGGPDSAALNGSLDELRRCLEDAGLVNAAPLADLLLAERHALLLQLHLNRHSAPAARAVQNRPPRIPVQAGEAHPVAHASGNGSLNGRMTDAMRQVLNALKSSEPSRSRDIIARCRPLSERTVKRSLQNLVTAGLVSKELQDGTVLYRASQLSA